MQDNKYQRGLRRPKHKRDVLGGDGAGRGEAAWDGGHQGRWHWGQTARGHVHEWTRKITLKEIEEGGGTT